MPQGEPIPAWEMEQIMALYKDYRSKGCGKTESYKKVSEIVGRPYQSVGLVVLRLSPTVGVAQDYIKSKALRMAKRLVKEAKANELIDVLSRSNIGVLAPKTENQGAGGFFLSVSVDTCGAVKVGAGSTGGWQPNQLEAPAQIIDVEPIERLEEPHVQRFIGRTQAYQEALERAKSKIRAARGGREEVQGVQEADLQPQK